MSWDCCAEPNDALIHGNNRTLIFQTPRNVLVEPWCETGNLDGRRLENASHHREGFKNIRRYARPFQITKHKTSRDMHDFLKPTTQIPKPYTAKPLNPSTPKAINTYPLSP